MQGLQGLLHEGQGAEDTITCSRLQRIVVEHMLRQGFSETAKELARQFSMDKLLDIDVFVQCKLIAGALKSRKTQECLAWCNEHKISLRKSKAGLLHRRIQKLTQHRAGSSLNYGDRNS